MVQVKEMLLRHLQNVVRGFVIVDHVLRRRDAATEGESKTSQPTFLPLRRVAAIVFILGPIYGAAMGGYAFVVGERTLVAQLPQMFYSGVKVPLLIAMTVAISLPSFFVINTLLGLRDDFREVLRAIVSAQAGLAIILVSLFPLTLFGYVSFAGSNVSYPVAILANAAMFGLASIAAQMLLRGYYGNLVKRNRRHQWMIRMWIFVYAFVGIQAGYVLRPFIGDPNTPTTFLRRESFQNAYVKVFELICNVLTEILT